MSTEAGIIIRLIRFNLVRLNHLYHYDIKIIGFRVIKRFPQESTYYEEEFEDNPREWGADDYTPEILNDFATELYEMAFAGDEEYLRQLGGGLVQMFEYQFLIRDDTWV
jgi:hypothetical protein